MNVDVIHSERTQAQRDNVVKSFRDGKVNVLLKTCDSHNLYSEPSHIQISLIQMFGLSEIHTVSHF